MIMGCKKAEGISSFPRNFTQIYESHDNSIKEFQKRVLATPGRTLTQIFLYLQGKRGHSGRLKKLPGAVRLMNIIALNYA